MKYIPYGTQSISEEDVQAVARVLRSDWLTTGPDVAVFEEKVAEYCGGQFAVAVNSATSALHIACLAVGLGPGDTLWTSPNTFVASANAGLYCGASVDFVDIDSQTYNMSVSKLKDKLIASDKAGKLPKVVIPVHFSGQSCEMKEIHKLSQQYGFFVIEDASHAIGASYMDGKVGCCQYSDMTVFSFHPVKIITTAEGGMIVTNNEQMRAKLVRLRSHGITRDVAQMDGNSDGDWYYQQIELGFNYRMTDVQAALGSSQLSRIDSFIERRRYLAAKYTQKLQDVAVITPHQHPDALSAWHLYVVCIDSKRTDKSRKKVVEELKKREIGVNVHYIPVHTQPYFRKKFGFRPEMFPTALAYYHSCISLPMYYGLTDEDQAYVINALREVLA